METTPEAVSENWLPDLLRSARLPENPPLKTLQERMDELANATAPFARTWWKWMMFIQGLCIIAPLLWLTRKTFNLPPAAAALTTLGTVILFVVALWWMRWRGMQRTWARARLVAEVARSQLAASVCPTSLTCRALDFIPAVHSLLHSNDAKSRLPWPEWREKWISKRLEDQLNYYRGAKEKAEIKRRQFTRWSTLFMDVMLALAAAGAVISMSQRAPQWLRMLGDYRIECALGVAGVLLPLGILLLQSLRYLQELNHRTARFARQITMLEKAREQIAQATTSEAAMEWVTATEEQLLAEVVDWYFEAETAEQFFQVREWQKQSPHKHSEPSHHLGKLRPVGWAWMIGGVGLFFMVRVILGRAPWVVGASAITLGWLSFSSPTDPEARSKLHGEGVLVDDAGQPWHLDPLRTPNGCIIIAHGLHDGVTFTAGGEESRWMRDMSQALQQKLADHPPNIGLVDWATAAAPTNIHRIEPGITVAKFLGDLAGIPSQAREVGDFLAFRLAQLILEKQIDRNAPLHLIGHSAGGFVVSRAALRLREMNLAPRTMHVTILDTPAPDTELIGHVPQTCPVDFYVTSPFVRGLDDNVPPANIYLKHIASKTPLSLLDSHSYAYKWFIQTIPGAKPDETGFGRSPFMQAETNP